MLPLRCISRNSPLLDRCDLEEAALPLNEYASLRDFFVRSLREGCRPIDPDPYSLVWGAKGAGAMIEQVKGFSYSVSSLLGASSFVPMTAEGKIQDESRITEQESSQRENSKKSWWRISLASPKVRETVSACPMKGLYYCVIYLKPGDYHCIHSPVDWNVLVRRHFSDKLIVWEHNILNIFCFYCDNNGYTISSAAYTVGRPRRYMAIAAIGATNVGSIELFIEPELQTNRPRKKLLPSEPAEEGIYEPEGVGVTLKKGDEVAASNVGSTVVLVFQAPTLNSPKNNNTSEFRFSSGDRILVGEALGR